MRWKFAGLRLRVPFSSIVFTHVCWSGHVIRTYAHSSLCLDTFRWPAVLRHWHKVLKSKDSILKWELVSGAWKNQSIKIQWQKKTNRKNIRRELMLVACACSMWPTLASIYYPAHRRHFSLLFFSLSRFAFISFGGRHSIERHDASIQCCCCCVVYRCARSACSAPFFARRENLINDFLCDFVSFWIASLFHINC